MRELFFLWDGDPSKLAIAAFESGMSTRRLAHFMRFFSSAVLFRLPAGPEAPASVLQTHAQNPSVEGLADAFRRLCREAPCIAHEIGNVACGQLKSISESDISSWERLAFDDGWWTRIVSNGEDALSLLRPGFYAYKTCIIIDPYFSTFNGEAKRGLGAIFRELLEGRQCRSLEVHTLFSQHAAATSGDINDRIREIKSVWKETFRKAQKESKCQEVPGSFSAKIRVYRRGENASGNAKDVRSGTASFHDRALVFVNGTSGTNPSSAFVLGKGVASFGLKAGSGTVTLARSAPDEVLAIRDGLSPMATLSTKDDDFGTLRRS